MRSEKIVALLFVSSLSILSILPLDADSSTIDMGSDPPERMDPIFSGGNGTKNDPYVVSNITELQNMNSNLSAHYKLNNDIDASNTSTWNYGKGFNPIGGIFTGSLDGQGFNISSLFINNNHENSLINIIGVNGKVLNLNISGNFIGVYNLGVITSINHGIIKNCHVNGEMAGEYYYGYCYMGGIAGKNVRGKIINCTTDMRVLGNEKVGGLVGENNGGYIINCSSYGEISGNMTIGGLVGVNSQDSVINNSHSMANISGIRNIGGLAGFNLGSIYNCYSKNNISANKYFGGMVGKNYNYDIRNSFYCIDDSIINGKNIVTPYGIYKQQFMDWKNQNKDLHIDDYLEKNTKTDYYNVSNVEDIKNMLPFALEDVYKFKQINNISLIDEEEIFIPIFFSLIYDGGSFSLTGLNIHQQNNNISLFGYVYKESIIKNILLYEINISGLDNVGGLVGENYGHLENCYIKGNIKGTNDTGGVVGRNNYCMIKNCSMTGNISGYGRYGGIGGIVGLNYNGVVDKCHTKCNVSGYSGVGGIFGGNIGYHSLVKNCSTNVNVNADKTIGGFGGGNIEGDIFKCYSKGTVKGRRTNGGFLGLNIHGRIYDSYSMCDVKGHSYVGGFIGFCSGIISNSYSTGKVSGAEYVGGFSGEGGDFLRDCFWDMESSQIAISNGGEGKNTSQMQNNKTFIEAGWDLENVWNITVNRTYPFLRWEENRAPIIITRNMETATEDSLYLVDYEFQDPNPSDTNPLWSLDTDAEWLSMDRSTGILSGIPENGDVGTYRVNISLFDGRGGWDSTVFSIEVINVNDGPEILTRNRKEALEDMLYSVRYVGSDPDGDDLTWHLDTTADWLVMDPYTGWLNGIPTCEGPASHVVNISLFDGRGGQISTSFILVVENVNDPPVITTRDVLVAEEDSLYSVFYMARDPDDSFEVLDWTLQTDRVWLRLDDNRLYGIPTNSDIGTWEVKVTVNDGNGGVDRRSFRIEVLNTNDPPIWVEVPGNQLLKEGDELDLNISALDIDPGDRVQYTLETIPETNISIESGSLVWTDAEPGTYLITLEASDGKSTIEHSFHLSVEERVETDELEDEPDKNILIPILVMAAVMVSIAPVIFVISKVRTGEEIYDFE